MSEVLRERYRAFVCDLDGVVYRGKEAVPYAVDALEAARAAGIGIVFATNNGSRPPEDVGAHLAELGLTIGPDSVLTSAQAAAARLVADLGAGAPVLAVGGAGVPLALERAGLQPVTVTRAAAGEPVRGVLQSYGADVAWTDLAEIAYAVHGGALWVASNADLTIPTARGIAPGNGTLVGAVRHAVDVDPVVVGKPETPLYDLSAATLYVSAAETLAIGDRLDTDIEGANRAGMDALFVATGVHGAWDLVTATGARRPRWIVADLRALAQPYADVNCEETESGWSASCGEARATLAQGRPEVSGGSPGERLRAAVLAGWAALDGGAQLDEAAWRGWDWTAEA